MKHINLKKAPLREGPNEQTCSRQCLAEKVPFGSKLCKIGSDYWGIPVNTHVFCTRHTHTAHNTRHTTHDTQHGRMGILGLATVHRTSARQ